MRQLPRGVGLVIAMTASVTLWKLILGAVAKPASAPPRRRPSR